MSNNRGVTKTELVVFGWSCDLSMFSWDWKIQQIGQYDSHESTVYMILNKSNEEKNEDTITPLI